MGNATSERKKGVVSGGELFPPSTANGAGNGRLTIHSSHCRHLKSRLYKSTDRSIVKVCRGNKKQFDTMLPEDPFIDILHLGYYK